MLDALRAAGGLNENPVLVRALFAVRWKLGAIFGWDKPREGLAGRVTTLRDRLPADLRQDEAGEPVPHTPFTMLYELDDECAIELANKTVHDICHLGWVPTSTGEYKLQMAALVKPNGRLGRLYMTAIKPLRHLIVYPALTRKWERAWLNRESYRPAATDPAAAATAGRAAASDTNHRPPQDSAAATGALPWDEAPRRDRRSPAITWAGRLIVFYGAAHTIGAFAVEGAGSHLQAWLRGDLRGGDLAAMSSPMSAYWLSVMSFGPPLVLIGCTVLWLNRRGLAAPSFLAWALGLWTVLDIVLAGPGSGQGLILLVAATLLVIGNRRGGPSDEAQHSTRLDGVAP